MTKRYFLGFLNILLAGFFIFILAKSTYSFEPLTSFDIFVHAYAPVLVLLLAALFNGAMAYRLLVKRRSKVPLGVFGLLTATTVFWFLLFFFGNFFASNPYFAIISLVLTGGLFFFLKKTSNKLAISVSGLTLLIFLVAFILSFEEDYCWKKGDLADPTGSKMIVATKEDAQALKGFDVKEGNKIGLAFRTHMLCHHAVDFGKALKERSFFR